MSQAALNNNPQDGMLAILGGKPVLPEGPPDWPPRLPNVRQSILDAVDENAWGKYLGRFTTELIQTLESLFHSSHIHLTSSGTIAVELALRGLGVGDGDEVILAAYDFPGNFRAIEMTGATPVLVDVVPGGWTLDSELLDAAKSPATKAIIASHMHSQLVPMQQLVRWSNKNSIAVVEDACQCPGAALDGRPVASLGHVGVLSFGGSKLLTAGRGGAVLTNDETVAQRILVYSERGNDAFPMSQLQAAALLPQLPELANNNLLRAKRLKQLVEKLDGNSLIHLPPVNVQGAYYKIPWLLDKAMKVSRDELTTAFRAEGVAIDSGFRGFAGRSERRCRKPVELIHAKIAAEQTLLLHHPVLLESEETMDRVAKAMTKVLGHYRSSNTSD